MLPNVVAGLGDVYLDKPVNDMSSSTQIARIQSEPTHRGDGLYFVCISLAHGSISLQAV